MDTFHSNQDEGMELPSISVELVSPEVEPKQDNWILLTSDRMDFISSRIPSLPESCEKPVVTFNSLLMCSLKVLGLDLLYPCTEPSVQRGCGRSCIFREIWNIVTVVCSMCYLASSIILYVINRKRNFLMFISCILRNVGSILTVVIFLINKRKIRSLIKNINTYLFFTDKSLLIRLQRFCFYSVNSGLIYVITFLSTVLLYILTSYRLDDILEEYYFGLTVSSFKEKCFAYLFVFLDWGMYSIVVWGVLVFIPILYMSLSIGVDMCFRTFNSRTKDITNSQDSIVLEHVTELLFKHDKLREMVDQMNTCLSFAPLVWYCLLLLVTCLEVTHLLIVSSTLKLHWIYEIFTYTQLWFVFLGTTVTAGKLIKTSQLSAVLVERLARKTNSASRLLVFFQFRILEKQVCAPVFLTAGGCFTISEKLILSGVGVMCTYTVLLIQLTPEALEKITG